MSLSNYHHFSLIFITILTISACNTMPASSGRTTTVISGESAPEISQTTEQHNQISAQLVSLQAQITELQNQMNDIRQQQATLSRYINIHAPASKVSASKDPAVANTSEARHLYNAGLYAQSIRLLKNADSGGNGNTQARERMWLLLQNHARLNNCESVINIGQRFASLFPQTSQSPNALYLVAQCQAHLQQQDIARTTYQRIISNYPNSSAAIRARHQLKK